MIENTCAEPGMHLAKYGVITIGVTVGGNVVCIDTNDVSDAGPKILLFDSNFCYYDDEDDIARIGYIPSSVEHLFDLTYDQKDPVLSYDNIQKCGHVLSESFMDFMEKLSYNYFEDMFNMFNSTCNENVFCLQNNNHRKQTMSCLKSWRIVVISFM